MDRLKDRKGAADAVVSYQTSDIQWQAEYVGILSENEKALDLTGWVSIDNRSGSLPSPMRGSPRLSSAAAMFPKRARCQA